MAPAPSERSLKIVELAKQGKNSREIADQLGCNTQTVYDAMHHHGKGIKLAPAPRRPIKEKIRAEPVKFKRSYTKREPSHTVVAVTPVATSPQQQMTLVMGSPDQIAAVLNSMKGTNG